MFRFFINRVVVIFALEVGPSSAEILAELSKESALTGENLKVLNSHFYVAEGNRVFTPIPFFGGDTAMLFAHKYPKLARKLITLDNRRMPLPRAKKPHILSIRSSDLPADDGVLPTAKSKENSRFKS